MIRLIFRPALLSKLLIVLLITVLLGCQPDPEGTQEPSNAADNNGKPVASSVLPGQAEIVARVNGSEITRYELEQAAVDTLGIENTATADNDALEKTYRNLLQSLVMMRSISQQAETVLTEKELAEIEHKSKAFHEELLTKAYLKQYVDPQPVTQEMVKTYYARHPEKFGGEKVRQYQLLSSIDRLSGEARETVTQVLADAVNQRDWNIYAQQQVQQGVRVRFRQGHSGDQLLQQQLRNMMQQTAIGEVSKPFYVQGRLFVVKIKGETQLPAKPLREVAADIRRALVPIQLRKGIEKVSTDLVKQSDVEIFLGH